MTTAASAAGVSVRCARRWVGRYKAAGEAGLVDRSSAPRRVANRTSAERVAVTDQRNRTSASKPAPVPRAPRPALPPRDPDPGLEVRRYVPHTSSALPSCHHARRVRRRPLIARLAVAALVVACLTACGGHGKATLSPATVPATDTTLPPRILTGPVRPVTFAQARRAIVRLYSRHPEIRSFVYQDVVYTPGTRDKVLATCRFGAASSNAREKETTRVFGCAPLIFFFYNFGRQKSVPESIEVARKLFWYAAEIAGPYQALPPLRDLLQRWSIR